MSEHIPGLTVGDVLQFKAGAAKPKKRWYGPAPKQCDICHVPLTQTFVDGRTQFGPWAIMCAGCHRDQAIGLGVGRGQRYDLKTLEKIDG